MVQVLGPCIHVGDADEFQAHGVSLVQCQLLGPLRSESTDVSFLSVSVPLSNKYFLKISIQYIYRENVRDQGEMCSKQCPPCMRPGSRLGGSSCTCEGWGISQAYVPDSHV